MNVLGTSLEVVGGSMSFPSSSVFGFVKRLPSNMLSCSSTVYLLGPALSVQCCASQLLCELTFTAVLVLQSNCVADTSYGGENYPMRRHNCKHKKGGENFHVHLPKDCGCACPHRGGSPDAAADPKPGRERERKPLTFVGTRLSPGGPGGGLEATRRNIGSQKLGQVPP